LTAHSLRHSAITIALMGGMSLQDTQSFARHQNLSTTLIYAHDVNRLKSMCEATISTAIFGSLQVY
ncbi:MAG: tyrosine-type recombinase/integrase, partial [Synergistaceae bacterium]|nr:tyrosine-type recombinase/integrase [Synergistaceae bacterium]